MALKRKSVDRDDGKDHNETATEVELGEPAGGTSILWKASAADSLEQVMGNSIDQVKYIFWKFAKERSSFRAYLGGDPAALPLVNQLGLAQAFSIDYCRPMRHAVQEFALGFNSERNYCDFRGRRLTFDRGLVRDAFLLPSGKSRVHYNSLDNDDLAEMFAMDPKSKCCYFTVSRLAGDYQNWARPILAFQALLLGMPSPIQLTRERIWYFSAYLSNKVEPSERPDWAELVHDHLKSEVVKLKNHLEKRPCDIKPGSRFRCSCGTAVTRILMHLGFTEEELSDATVERRSEGGVPNAGFADPVNPAKSTWMLGKEIQHSTKKKRSEGGAPPASFAAALGVELNQGSQIFCRTDTTISSSSLSTSYGYTYTESFEYSSTDRGSQDSDRDSDVLSSWSSRQPVESMESQNRSGGEVNVQQKSSNVECGWTKAKFDEKKNEIVGIVTSVDAQNQEYAAELAEQKQKADAQFLKLNIEKGSVQNQLDLARTEWNSKLATLQSETGKIERERDTALLELKALREEKKRLHTAHETVQKNLEDEKQKRLCHICRESPIDTIFLPCLHFHYCFSCFESHNKRSRTCPTCRMPISGELRARIWT